jgi:hypothetical protein
MAGRLQDRLDRMKAGFEKTAPPENLEIMHRVTGDLRRSGIMDSVARAGQAAPGFTLDDSRGRPVGLALQLSRGPVILTFYRGVW